ncbi:MAG: hypothetical protein NTZ49_00705, partial [Candidatus Parcubacteria bacterium]|nr:hypothetical protein [Candidatus Parcubacteria bacterium]
MMKYFNRKLIFSITLGLFLISSAFVLAQENNETTDNQDSIIESDPQIEELNLKIEENKTKIENLKKASAEYADKIEEYKDEASNLKNQLGLMDNQVIKIELDAKTLKLQIDKIRLEIESLEYQIANKETEIEKYKQNLIEYIRQIAKDDQKTYLEILITNASFSEFFTQLTYLEEIQSDIQTTVNRLNLLKESVSLQKAEKEKQKNDLLDMQDKLASKEDKLKDELKAKEIILLQTKTSEIGYQKLLAAARQEQNEIDNEIYDIQNKIKDKIEKLKKEGTTAQTTLLNWPVPSQYVTAYFHDPDYPFRYVYEHPAIDIRAKQGTQIVAPADGYVARTVDAGMG